MKKTIEAFIFDLGGVLLDWNPRHLYRKMFNGDNNEMEYFLSDVCPSEWNVSFDAGYPIAKGIEERLALYPDYENYIRAWWDRWPEMIKSEIKDTVDILKALKDKGYAIYALSNWSAETYPLVYEKFEFLSWFDEVVLSGAEKLIKPDPAIYQLLLDRTGHQPEACIFIDDSIKNIIAAEEMGINGIHFTSSSELFIKLNDMDFIE